jgi:dihydrofolate reductase
MEGTGEFGEKMNAMPKYVVSSTLERLDWSGSKLIKGDVAGEVRKLKDAPGGDLLLSGSAQLFKSMMEADLIDLYRLMVHPIVMGKGKRLFDGDGRKRVLDLASIKQFETGIVVLELLPARKSEAKSSAG